MDEGSGKLSDITFTSKSSSEGADLGLEDHERLLPADEGRQVIEFEESFWQGVTAGQTCYAVDANWWRKWCSYTGVHIEDRKSARVVDLEKETERPPRPDAIDNSELENPESTLQEGIDYTFKSPATWKFFEKLYPGSGPKITRPVLADGKTNFFLYTFRVHRSSQLPAKTPREVHVPTSGTCGDLKTAACNAFGLEELDVQLWDFYNCIKQSTDNLEDRLDEQMDSIKLIAGQDILLEEKVDGKFQGSPEESSPGPSYDRPLLRYNAAPEDTAVKSEGTLAGLAGLSNLGNTCFMNSSLQCLAHSIPLVQIFLSDAYKADLNQDNPLGNKGQLAEAFGSVMKKLWQGDVRVVTPSRFKQQIASFAPHFAGYQQHDSQELLAFLLDGLHEDLNRVKKKPYIEEPDSDGRPDDEIAAEAWRNYKARNDSYIVDHFQGMYKSTLVCPDCRFQSVKMDSFNCLSLPLPAAKMRTIEVTVVAMDGSAQPLQYALEVLKLGTIGDLYKALAKICEVDEEDPTSVLLLVEIYDGKVHTKFVDMSEPLADGIRGYITLLAYKYPSRDVGPASGGKELHVFQRRARKRSTFYFTSGDEYEVFAAPLLLWLPEDRIKHSVLPDSEAAAAPDDLTASCGPIGQAVKSALRPFKRQKLTTGGPALPRELSTEPAEPTSQHVRTGSGSSGESSSPAEKLDALESAQQTEIEMLGVTGDRQAAQDLGPAGDADRDGSPANMDSMAVMDTGAVSVSPRETPETSPMLSPIGTPQYQDGWSASFDSSLAKPAPFDMFQAQAKAEPPPFQLVSTDQERVPSSSAPYKIQVAAPNGEPSNRQPCLEDGQLFFAIDWASDSANEFEPERIEQPELHSSVQEAKARQAAGPKPYTLDECIEAFLEGERLEDSESWYCKRCRKLVQADKKLDLWSLPEVLVVHLKRFSYSHRFRDKIDALVKFPLTELDLSKATLKPQEIEPLYDLFAVSNHFGGLGGGHYTAFCKVGESGRWYCFDDSSTYEVDSDRVMSSSAYVLFYRRRAEGKLEEGKSIGRLVADFAETDTGARVLTPEPAEAQVLSAPGHDKHQLGEKDQLLAPGEASLGVFDKKGRAVCLTAGRCSNDSVQEPHVNGLLAESMLDWASRTHM